MAEAKSRTVKRELDLAEDEHPRQPEKVQVLSFRCKKCRRAMKVGSKDEMKRHYADAHGITTVDCDACQKIFPSVQQLLEHKNAKHSFPCPSCSKICAKPTYLREHIKSVHGLKDEKFKCDLCLPDHVEFNTKDILRQHLKEAHVGAIQTCSICQYKAAGDEDLIKHKESHVSHKCNECGETFPTGGQYHKHRKRTKHDPWVKKN